MTKKIFLLLVVGISAGLLAGCVNTLDGRKKAGLPFAKDRVEGRYERTPKELWDAAQDVLKYNGTLYSVDSQKSTLEANVDQRIVWVRVEEVDSKISRVIVQCRTKGGGADVEMAGYIDKQIAIRLATGNLTPTTPTQRVY